MRERASAIGGLEKLADALNSFRCCKDNDIETFLRSEAFKFLDHGWCSIYLILNEQEFDDGIISVEGYFTLSHKSLISDGISKTKVQKVTGGFKNATSFHFVLIGQLGKHIECTADGEMKRSQITSKELLDYAFEVIKASSALIPCRFVLVECNDNPKVHKVYTDYQFQKFQFDGEHHQFIKKL